MSSSVAHSGRFRLHLTLLILLPVIPALLLAIYTGIEQRKLGKQRAEEGARMLARLAATDHEHLIDSARQVLAPLADLPLIHTTNAAFWNVNFKNLVLLQPRYSNVGLVETNGHLFASAAKAAKAGNLSNREFVTEVLRTRTFSFGGLEQDLVSTQRVLTFGYPVLNPEGAVVRILFATLDLGILDTLPGKTQLPPAARMLVFDRKGALLARGGEVSTAAESSGSHRQLFEAIAAQRDGSIRLADPDGVRYLYGVASARDAGTIGPITAVGFPSHLAFANANRLLLQNLVILAFAACAAIGVAQFYARKYMLRPMDLLMEAANRLAQGDLQVRADSKHCFGLYPLAIAFNAMAERVHELIAELEQRNGLVAAAESKFRALIEQSLVGIYVIQGGKFVYVNPKMQEIFGVSRERLLDSSIYDFIPPQDQELVRGNIRKRLAGEVQSVRYTLAIVHGNGSRRDVEVHGSRTAYEGTPSIIGAMLDITDRNEAEKAIRQLNAELTERVAERTAELSAANVQLAQSSKLKDEFLANMSHELRTPLNAILGLSEGLIEQGEQAFTPRQLKSLKTIFNSGTHLLSLINDILDLSKIEAGKMDLKFSSVNVEEFCQGCLAFVRTQAMQKKIGIVFENSCETPSLEADPKRLKQILVNLLTNAVKFTPEGGRIGLSVETPSAENIVRITVWDTGIGIAPADAAKLFQAFTQIDSGLSRAQEGTGLGLALVAKLVELHGGSVALESEPGKGSRFIIILPKVASAPIAPVPEIPQNRQNYSRAMIIEDDVIAGELIIGFLQELGIKSVLHVLDQDAVQTALKERPDFIILDLVLPTDSGWVLLARLKDHPQTRDIPIIVASMIDEPQKSLALGAAAHLTKPITRKHLADFLQRGSVPRTLLPWREEPGSVPGGPLILLAEDNEANIQTIGGYLQDNGYELRCAENGTVAVERARTLRPACILMDIQMPVMDGLTAIKEIRSDPTLQEIPIIALTALAMPGDRERCIATGATDYMSKPVSLKALKALIHRLLQPASVSQKDVHTP